MGGAGGWDDDSLGTAATGVRTPPHDVGRKGGRYGCGLLLSTTGIYVSTFSYPG